MTQSIKEQIKALIGSPELSQTDYRKARAIYINGNCQILSRSARGFDVLVNDDDEDNLEANILYSEEESLRYFRDGKPLPWDSYGLAALMQIDEELAKPQHTIALEGKRYSREGMAKRVLKERKAKALKAKYTIRFADNIYGEHLLINEKGTRYKITLRDFENETGYTDNPDLKTNKLGTTKHIIFAFDALKAQPETYNNLSKFYPFVEIYLDPLNDYRITWHYPHSLKSETAALITKYFGDKKHIEEDAVKDFLTFIREAAEQPQILIRPEVEEKIKKAWDREMLEVVKKEEELDFSLLKGTLFPLSAGRSDLCHLPRWRRHCR
ncbi:hypothetical protein [Daejeonella sp.]|uniref:hypothetical protein n=1 Tax=Daejeonella sp. TaxID=2805397 RepID=UPI0030C1096D